MIRATMILLPGAADLVLVHSAWSALGQHQGLGVVICLLTASSIVCHIAMLRE